MGFWRDHTFFFLDFGGGNNVAGTSGRMFPGLGSKCAFCTFIRAQKLAIHWNTNEKMVFNIIQICMLERGATQIRDGV
jgi:hypothetical protein